MSVIRPEQTDVRRPNVSEPAGISRGSLATRVVTGLGYGLTVIACVWFGKWPIAVLFGLMAALGSLEFLTFTHHRNRLPCDRIGILASAGFPLAAAAWGSGGSLYVLTGLLIAVLALHVLFERTRTSDLTGAVFSAVYIGYLLSHLVLLRTVPNIGREVTFALVFSVWAGDVFAYFVGSLFGKHKMAPRISPKKSWEGFAAGLAACVAVWAGLTLVPAVDISLTLGLLTGLGVGIASVIGDLAESRLKREAGVKDSGTSLPGHGGFFDRLDSLILASTAAYWILVWGGVA